MTKAAPRTSAFSLRSNLTAARRAARGDEIVNEQHRLTGLQRILVDLDDVDAVFQLVLLADGLRRQLALLADGHEAAAKAVGDGAAEDEAARLDAGNRLDPPVGKRRDQPLDAGAQPLAWPSSVVMSRNMMPGFG